MSLLLRCSLLILLLVSVAWGQSVDARLLSVRNAPIAVGTKAAIKEIKGSPLYHDAGVEESSNWLARALERLQNLFNRPERNLPNVQLPAWLGRFLTVFMWLLLGVAVLIFAFFVARHYRWRLSLRRKATAMVEDDEPDRSANEWLRLADEYERQGDIRRAVRSLYLACLLRFDEARIARFDRGQTNWEHLARIHSSPRRPRELEFTAPTKAFDRIWYGSIVRGPEDVGDFRETYSKVHRLTEGVVA